MSEKLPAGWSQPGGSRKYHYFRAGDMMCLCRAYILAGIRDDDNHDSPDNCTKCKKIREQSLPKGSK